MLHLIKSEGWFTLDFEDYAKTTLSFRTILADLSYYISFSAKDFWEMYRNPISDASDEDEITELLTGIRRWAVVVAALETLTKERLGQIERGNFERMADAKFDRMPRLPRDPRLRRAVEVSSSKSAPQNGSKTDVGR